MAITGQTRALYCPGFPENGRSVFMGHLFVGDQLLNESSMKDHPLTPMRDANLARVLAPQVKDSVGIWSRVAQKSGDGMPDATHIIGDAVEFADLEFLITNTPPDVLLTGGSALAMPLPLLLNVGSSHSNPDPRPGPRALVLSGSCSQMTQQQVAHYIETNPSYQLHPETLNEATIQDCIQWLRSTEQNDTPLVYATASPDAVKAAQTVVGVAEAGAVVERAMALIARAAYEIGVRRFVVAGGETSGAVTQSLGVSEVIIGREICPGVPWVFNRSGKEVIGLALKSGNFGSPSFFSDALSLIGD
jgi:uncharacterized protein YgbK (DUF1537 family)